MKRIFILLILSVLHMGLQAQTDLKPVATIDWSKFSGTWFLVSRLPNELDRDLKNVSVTYLLKEKKIKETFLGTNQKGKQVKIKSTLKIKDPGVFHGPFGKPYYVILLAPGYEYAAVATPDMKYLYVMSRTKHLDNNTYNAILSDLASMKFETTKLVMMPQQ